MKKYKVIENMFPGLSKVIAENLTLEEAKKFSSDHYDNYTSYSVEEMPLTIAELRKLKLDELKQIEIDNENNIKG